MRLDLDQLARVAYEAIRAYDRAVLANNPVPWDSAPPAWRRVTLKCVEALMACPGCSTPGTVHTLWLAAKADEGWRYGPRLDHIELTSPLMVPYHQLPESERVKDRLFVSVILALHPGEPDDPDRFSPRVHSV